MPISKEELGRRLKAAREACKFTQDEVADRLGVSRSTIAQMELGNRPVGGAELERLAYLFGRDPRELFAERFEAKDGLVALFRAEPENGDRDVLIDAVRKCLALAREITNLERLLGIDRTAAATPTYLLAEPRSKWEAVQQGLRAAEEERRRLSLGSVPLPDIVEMLETQGIRTASQDLPDKVSGLTLTEPSVGVLVVVNGTHRSARIRFSFAHEYAHVLLDRDRPTVSRADQGDKLVEVRANSFAAGFLMPEDGVRRFAEALGKGKESRSRATVFDGRDGLAVEGRTEPGTQDIKMYDLVLVAHHFQVSPIAALYRLKNVSLLSDPELQALKAAEPAQAKEIARHLSLPDPDGVVPPLELKHRFLGLALEAYRRDKISRAKLRELAELIGHPAAELDHAIADLRIDE